MNNNELKFIENPVGYIFSRYRVTVYVALAMGMMLAGLVYIFGPVLPGGEARIVLNEYSFSYKVNTPYGSSRLYFHVPINITSYKIHPVINGKYQGLELRQSSDAAWMLDGPQNVISISPEMSIDKKADYYEVELTFIDQWPRPSINRVEINDSRIDLSLFYKNYIISDNVVYEDRNYIREDIATFLYKYNDGVSNYFLTFMSVILMPMFIYLCYMAWRRFFVSETGLTKYLLNGAKPSEISKDSLIDVRNAFAESYAKKSSFFRFLQILGPALGFALTTSSLIAGLYPTQLQSPDITEFFHTIQIAMVSTFLGLLIRLLAISLQRLNAGMLGRVDVIFSNYARLTE